MSFDSLWEACRRAYIEHKSDDLCATCKNNYKASLRLCVCVCVAENPLHNLLTWHWSAPPAPPALPLHGAHAVCQMCWVRPPPPFGIFCNICDCLAATAGSSRCLNRCLCHRHLTCCQSKCLWRTLHASQRLAGCRQAARTFRCIRKAVYSNKFWNDAATDGMAYCKDTTQPVQLDETRPAQSWPGLQHWLPWAH